MTADEISASAWLVRLVAVSLFVGAIFGTVAGVGGATDPPIQISTNVTPSDPTVEESVTIDAIISNIENSESRNVDVRYVYLRQSGMTIDRFESVGTVGSGGSLSLPLSATFDDPGQKRLEIEITTQYSDDDSEIYTYTHPVFIDVTESDLQGEVQLTSVETSARNGVTIQGDAANIGNSDVQSVLLSVSDTEGVTPKSPNGEYFVGGIDASEFATFDLTADIEPETDSIPVEITYIVDDERVTKTQQIAVESTNTTAPPPNTQAAASGTPPSSGLPLLPIGVVVVLLVIGVVGTVLWRRQ
ncbi:hypothetical protein [Halohasta litorea]|uniref:CARDB domain-containing protein n=1 Tax=Halohasta litorea TaxID=869891 RepID=A0ABD6DBY6_9EURY|nr:hypothetical protein [Halohasta litorea]